MSIKTDIEQNISIAEIVTRNDNSSLEAFASVDTIEGVTDHMEPTFTSAAQTLENDRSVTLFRNNQKTSDFSYLHQIQAMKCQYLSFHDLIITEETPPHLHEKWINCWEEQHHPFQATVAIPKMN